MVAGKGSQTRPRDLKFYLREPIAAVIGMKCIDPNYLNPIERFHYSLLTQKVICRGD